MMNYYDDHDYKNFLAWWKIFLYIYISYKKNTIKLTDHKSLNQVGNHTADMRTRGKLIEIIQNSEGNQDLS